MKFIIQREHLLKPLQQVTNLLSNRLMLPILSNLLLKVKENYLLLISTNLEIEMIARINLSQPYEQGAITIPARKFFDICRGLPEQSKLNVTLKNKRFLISSYRSRFSLSTLPALDFPNIDNWTSEVKFYLPHIILKQLIESTQFSMACQDVRYYLNGMLFEIKNEEFRSITSDGHRLSICSIKIDRKLPLCSVIVPRKGIIELIRLLNNNHTLLELQIGKKNIRAHIGDFTFSSKLVDGQFPDYHRVLPKNPDKRLKVNCDLLKKAFSRAAILSNEKCRGVRLYINNNQLKITANNSEQEEAEEILEVYYKGDPIEISFNVNYILDVLNVLKCDNVILLLTDSFSSVTIKDEIHQTAFYVIMPMRL
ncbi:Beta sliding clamp [Candidatus Ecksteinia adelgidicola]|nr:Beta sliding clamp [Candidatus Ecksteinia adelgidicola]